MLRLPMGLMVRRRGKRAVKVRPETAEGEDLRGPGELAGKGSAQKIRFP